MNHAVTPKGIPLKLSSDCPERFADGHYRFDLRLGDSRSYDDERACHG